MTNIQLDQTGADSISVEAFLEQINDRRLVDLYRYWDGLRGKRFAPSFKEVDPVEIPRLLENLLVTDVETGPNGRRYRFRLCGTEVEKNFGGPMRGRYIDMLMQGRYLNYMTELYDRVVEQKNPLYSVSSYRNRILFTKRLMLPLSSDGRSVDIVFSAQVFVRSSGLPQTVLAVQDDFESRPERDDGSVGLSAKSASSSFKNSA